MALKLKTGTQPRVKPSLDLKEAIFYFPHSVESFTVWAQEEGSLQQCHTHAVVLVWLVHQSIRGLGTREWSPGGAEKRQRRIFAAVLNLGFVTPLGFLYEISYILGFKNDF